MFKSGSTVIHQGAYFFNILCMMLCLLLLGRISGRLPPIVAALHILLFLSVYAPNPYGGGQPYMLLTLLLTLMCVASCLLPCRPGKLATDHENTVRAERVTLPCS